MINNLTGLLDHSLIHSFHRLSLNTRSNESKLPARRRFRASDGTRVLHSTVRARPNTSQEQHERSDRTRIRPPSFLAFKCISPAPVCMGRRAVAASALLTLNLPAPRTVHISRPEISALTYCCLSCRTLIFDFGTYF